MINIDGTKYSTNEILYFLHKIYNGKYKFSFYKFKLSLCFIKDSQKHYIPLFRNNIYDIVYNSLFLPSAEGENFIEKLIKHNNIEKYNLTKYYKRKRLGFILFLLKHLKQYTFGENISNQLFIKFYFKFPPKNIAYSSQGRKFIDYSKQISQTGTIFDNIDGSGLSVGYFDRVFLYFRNYMDYGEELLILKPIKNQKYRLDRYECLGDKFAVVKNISLSDPEGLKYILLNMSIDSKTSFLNCDKDNTIETSYGQIDKTIKIMKEIDPIKYKDAINYLLKLYNSKENSVESKTTS